MPWMPWSTCFDQNQSFRSVPYVKYMFSSETELPLIEQPGQVGVPAPPLVPLDPPPVPELPPPVPVLLPLPELPLLLAPFPLEPVPDVDPVPLDPVPLPPDPFVDVEENTADPLYPELTTDFGTRDGYVGAMKGAMAGSIT